MAAPSLAREAVEQTAAYYRQAVAEGCVALGQHIGTGKRSAASRVAELLGISASAASDRLRNLRHRGMLEGVEADAPAHCEAPEFPEIPSDEPDYAELKSRMIADFARLRAHKEASKLLRVKVRIDGPYGLMPFGDPHIDNNGTDWPMLDRHMGIIKKTEGLFATNIGDTSDNWLGRLSRLYAESNISRKRALILMEGFMREIPWLYLDRGNHDAWSGADDPLIWLARANGVHYKWEGSRVELVPSSGASCIVNSRHDFPGRSQYHPTHGPLKAATFDDYSDDIYIAGHIHQGGYMLRVSPSGRISHLLRLSSYKVYDAFKDQRGFQDGALPAAVFVMNPHADTPESRVSFFADPEAGADYLRFLRKPRIRVAAGRAS